MLFAKSISENALIIVDKLCKDIKNTLHVVLTKNKIMNYLVTFLIFFPNSIYLAKISIPYL